MKKTFLLLLVILLALFMTSCIEVKETTPSTAPPETSAPPSATAPGQTTAQAPETAVPPDPEPVLATDEPDMTLVAKAIDYLPAVNQLITMSVNTGGDDLMTISYAFAVTDNPDEGYVLTRFVYDQPYLYTDYFMDDQGLWGLFSDSEGEERYFILPAEMKIGTEFVSRGEQCVVMMIDATFKMGGYMADGCLVIRTKSNTYSGSYVFTVYEPGYGEIAQYIPYDENVTDLINIFESSSELTDDQIQEIIADSRF